MKHDFDLGPLRDDWRETPLPYTQWVRSFVSGDPEGERIRVRFYKGSEDSVLWGRVWFGPAAEGPPGHAHGGAQAAVLDELLGGAAWIYGHPVVALNLQTDFLAFVPLRTSLVLRGTILRTEGRKVYTEGTIEDGQGQALARGKGLFLELNEEQRKRFS